MSKYVLLAVVLAWCSGVRGQTSGWRGDGSGVYPDVTPPTDWCSEPKKNIGWTVHVGGGVSSPVVVEGNVFVSAEPDHLICISRFGGKVRWDKETQLSDLPPEIKARDANPAGKCGNAAATPVCDGKYVYVAYANGLVSCFDVDGKRQWVKLVDRDGSPPDGRTASPILVGDRLIVPMGCMNALDAQAGSLLWKADDAVAGPGTPLALDLGKTKAVITPAGDVINVDDGTIMCKDAGTLEYSSPVYRDGVVYFIEAAAQAVNIMPKSATEAVARQIWQQSLQADEMRGSVAIRDGLIYAMDRSGAFWILDADKGGVVYHADAETNSPDNDATMYPSVTVAGKYVYLMDTRGQTRVLAAGKEAKEISRPRLIEGTGATPAFAGDQIFIRGGENLYCIRGQ